MPNAASSSAAAASATTNTSTVAASRSASTAPTPEDSHGEEDNNHATTPSTTNNSTATNAAAAGGVSKGALKDRPCPYCHQPFTSSSLGRHLDQYITKKQPDGIHNVAEIRRIRGGITRRQARNSSKQDRATRSVTRESGIGLDNHDDGADDGRTVHSTTESPSTANVNAMSNTSESAHYDLNHTNDGLTFNSPSWQATGVINLTAPSLTNGTSSSAAAGTAPRRGSYKPPTLTTSFATARGMNGNVGGSGNSGSSEGLASRSADLAEKAHFRAVELALKEVLNNIKAASMHTQPRPSPFDFDFQAQTFPSLCLLLLPYPPSLFSTHVIHSPNTYSLEPPGPAQLELLRHQIHTQVEQWKQEQLSTMSDDADSLHRAVYQHEEMALKHLDLAVTYWSNLSMQRRQESWQLELMRGFARETAKREEIEAQLTRVQQEANTLRVRVEQLSSLQWPREFVLAPPETVVLDRKTLRELQSNSAASAAKNKSVPPAELWDFDHVVGKWKRLVQDDQARRFGAPPPPSTGGQQQATNPSLASPGVSMGSPNLNNSGTIRSPLIAPSPVLASKKQKGLRGKPRVASGGNGGGNPTPHSPLSTTTMSLDTVNLNYNVTNSDPRGIKRKSQHDTSYNNQHPSRTPTIPPTPTSAVVGPYSGNPHHTPDSMDGSADADADADDEFDTSMRATGIVVPPSHGGGRGRAAVMV